MKEELGTASKVLQWDFPKPIDSIAAKELATQLNVSLPIASMLYRRGVQDFETAKKYFRPSLADLHDPFLMKDMDRAVSRLVEAIEKKQRILIYGDYDVDGTTSVTLVYSFLAQFSDTILYYIPDRHKEGYGVSLLGMQWAKDHDVDLIISLDCGIKSFKAIELCNSLGMDFIVCDHHKPDVDALPAAYAILDPKRYDCLYPYKELSGCGVGFK